MDYIIALEQKVALHQAEAIDAHGLYVAFQQIPDGRKKRGVRYPLALLLTLIVLAKLTGEVSLNGVVDWVRLRHEWLNEQLGLQQKRWPCFSTYTYALSKLDAQECTRIISAALTRLETSRRCEDEPARLLTQQGAASSRHVAFDGKAMRGTNGHASPNQPAVHLCAFYEVNTGNVLAQREVQSKENEISAIKEMLTPMLVKGRIITADAMHTQRFFCQTVKRYEGDYVLIAKDNQPTMREDLELFFEDPGADRSDWQTYESIDKGHGRLERRKVTTSGQMREWFAGQWRGIEQVFRIERTTVRDGKITHEIVYGITSLTRKQADAKRLAELIRAHWAIENRNHWRRDVTLCEDDSQVRTKHVPAVLAFLHTTLLALMDLLGVRNVAAQMRLYNAHPVYALRLLLSGTL
jgi:predicted transposase YbfD/YdcC